MVRLRRRHIVLLIESGAANAKRSRAQAGGASSHAASPARKRRRGEQSRPDGGGEGVSVLSSLLSGSKGGADGGNSAKAPSALRGLTRLDVLHSLHQRALLQFSEEKAALMNGKLGIQHVDQKSGLALLFVDRAHIADWLPIIEGVRSFAAGSTHSCKVVHVAGSASQLKRALEKLSRGVKSPPALSTHTAADWSALIAQVSS